MYTPSKNILFEFFEVTMTSLLHHNGFLVAGWLKIWQHFIKFHPHLPNFDQHLTKHVQTVIFGWVKGACGCSEQSPTICLMKFHFFINPMTSHGSCWYYGVWKNDFLNFFDHSQIFPIFLRAMDVRFPGFCCHFFVIFPIFGVFFCS